MSGHQYRMNYRLIPRPEGFDKAEAKRLNDEEDLGSCDAVFVASIINNDDGSSSHAMFSMDGKTGEELDALELFKVWTLMANALSNDERLGEGRRALCHHTFEVVRAAVLQARTAPPPMPEG